MRKRAAAGQAGVRGGLLVLYPIVDRQVVDAHDSEDLADAEHLKGGEAGTSDREVRHTRTKSRTNAPRFRQTEQDVPRHQSRSNLR